MNTRLVCDGLEFPEGPIALADGSVLVVEVRAARMTHVGRDGTKRTVASWGDPLAAGPNGAAMGPDGTVYVCNNGGFFWHEIDGVWHPQDPATGSTQSPVYGGGSIDRVDLNSGQITTLYDSCDGVGLRGPNDLVFDSAGGFWFTDFGKSRPGVMDIGAVYYARADGSAISRPISGLMMPNGVGLSPAGDTLYVAETRTGRLWAFDLDGAGQLREGPRRMIDGHTGRCLLNTIGYFDSLAVQANGDVVVAALGDGLCVVTADGATHATVALDDPIVTNICFGGPDHRTAYVTLSASGRLVALDWPTAGLALAH